MRWHYLQPLQNIYDLSLVIFRFGLGMDLLRNDTKLSNQWAVEPNEVNRGRKWAAEG